jgi:hypothetical protein
LSFRLDSVHCARLGRREGERGKLVFHTLTIEPRGHRVKGVNRTKWFG